MHVTLNLICGPVIDTETSSIIIIKLIVDIIVAKSNEASLDACMHGVVGGNIHDDCHGM